MAAVTAAAQRARPVDRRGEPRMLTQTLRGLERDGLVERTVTASVPVRVDYALTPPGCDLAPLMTAFTRWAEHHTADVLAARDRYDADRPEPEGADRARGVPRHRRHQRRHRDAPALGP